ncbi:uncharacterized protein LOC108678719 isoform X2 [Hyalella azteca]|uniref:RING-type E3 ubiquitin transferase n=1 Tax=Hyalella azteca TaxID=294128 RepID=A0A8B7PA72_HYAAZ|nr:uncharacterized protein LOC108678719 isoform X2 [Hyalella azteca]
MSARVFQNLPPAVKQVDDLLRCGICYEFLQTSVMTTCSHNYCSLCIRQSLLHRQSCPTCQSSICDSELRPNRTLDCIIELFPAIRDALQRYYHEQLSSSSLSSSANTESKLTPRIPESGNKHYNQYDSKQDDSAQTGLQCNLPSNFSVLQSGEIKNSFTSQNNSKHGKNLDPSMCSSTSKRKLSVHPSSQFSEDIICLETPSKANYGAGSSTSSNKTPQKSGGRLTAALNSINDGVVGSPSKRTSLLDYFSPKKCTPTKVASTITTSLTSSPQQSCGSLASISSSPVISKEETVSCPVCGVAVAQNNINRHLDACLQRDAATGAAVHPNPAQLKRPPLPKLVYHLLSDTKLRNELKKVGLSTNGSRDTLIKRHKKYVVLYNSECDKLEPRPIQQLHRQAAREEQIQPTQSTQTIQSIFSYDCKSSPTVIEEGQKKIQKKFSNQFASLLADLKKRRKLEGRANTDVNIKPEVNIEPEVSIKPEVTIKPEVSIKTELNIKTEFPPSTMVSGSADDEARLFKIEPDDISDPSDYLYCEVPGNSSVNQPTLSSKLSAQKWSSPPSHCNVAGTREIPRSSQCEARDEIFTPRRSKLTVQRRSNLSYDIINQTPASKICDIPAPTSPIFRTGNSKSLENTSDSNFNRATNVPPSTNDSVRVMPKHYSFDEDDDDFDDFLFEDISNEGKSNVSRGSDTVYGEQDSTRLLSANENLVDNFEPSDRKSKSPLETVRKCKSFLSNFPSTSSAGAKEADTDDDIPSYDSMEASSKLLRVSADNASAELEPYVRLELINGLSASTLNTKSLNSAPNMIIQAPYNGPSAGSSLPPGARCSPDLFTADAEDSDASSECSYSLLDDRAEQLMDVDILEDSRPPAVQSTEHPDTEDDSSDEIPASQLRLKQSKVSPSLRQSEAANLIVEQLPLDDNHAGAFDRSFEAYGRLHEEDSDDVLGAADADLPSLGATGCESPVVRRSGRRPPARLAALSHKVALCRRDVAPVESKLDNSVPLKSKRDNSNSSSKIAGRKRKSCELSSGPSTAPRCDETTAKRRSTRRRNL